MSVPKAYLTSFKNLKPIITAIQNAQAPPKFTVRFLESLGFKSPADRLIIPVFKSLGLLNQNGEPTRRYFEFMDPAQAPRILADSVREAYGGLFQINTKAYELSNTEVKNKLRTVSEGLYKDSVLDKMAGTFKALSNLADFTASSPSFQITEQPESESAPKPEPGPAKPADAIFKPGLRIGGLVYNIQIQLPESRDGAVYDALFKSLKEHLL